jgi:hypothetical protein
MVLFHVGMASSTSGNGFCSRQSLLQQSSPAALQLTGGVLASLKVPSKQHHTFQEAMTKHHRFTIMLHWQRRKIDVSSQLQV